MSAIDTRDVLRDSLFQFAEICIEGSDNPVRVKLCNLSPFGMMGEGGSSIVRGAEVCVNLRNIGWTEGVIAWVQNDRFGVAFNKEIDPQQSRLPAPKPHYNIPNYYRDTPVNYGIRKL